MYIKFSSIFDSFNYRKRVLAQVLVTGKSDTPFTIPKTIEIKCSVGEGCNGCVINGSKLEISCENNSVLDFVDMPSSRFLQVIKKLVNRGCKTLSYDTLEVQSIERIFISAPAGRSRERSTSTHVAYYVGHGIEANYNYEISGIPTVEPDTQESTIVFDKAKKLKTDIETFKMTDEIHNQLKQFNVENNVEAIYKYLRELYNVYAHNITQIYQRFDLHLAMDLAFRSVISFKFSNEIVAKATADILIIGDGRTGKGYVANRLSKYYDIGEIVVGDNCSYAGIVAGLVQHKGHWAVNWGALPLNDLGLVILDEASELKDEWTKLSGIRADGIASVDKIIKAKTNARTRLVVIANPPKKKIANYSYGVQALHDLIPTHEDIARFDYALIVADTEIASIEANTIRQPLPEMHDRESEQNLILWAWSRQQDDIEFTTEAVNEIYSLAEKIGDQYVTDVQLIQSTNVRIKLAKIAAMFAARVYSNKDNGKILLVNDIHVQCAYLFLNLIYKKPVCGYFTMSQLIKSTQQGQSEGDLTLLANYFKTFRAPGSEDELCKCLLSNNIITVRDISEHMNLDMPMATEVVSKLLKFNMIIKKFQNSYVKNRQFTEWLKGKVIGKSNMEVT